MTEKQEKIIQAALTLFAKEGYKMTSTSKVAKLAGVSEGLIFRHYKNKEGLLQAILDEGEEQSKLLFADIVMELDPKKVIQKTLDIGKRMMGNEEESNFWKLQYKIKWELEMYAAHKMEPLQNALENAFNKLEYPDPKNASIEIMLVLDGLATRYFLQEDFDAAAVINYLENKYR